MLIDEVRYYHNYNADPFDGYFKNTINNNRSCHDLDIKTDYNNNNINSKKDESAIVRIIFNIKLEKSIIINYKMTSQSNNYDAYKRNCHDKFKNCMLQIQ